MKGKFKMRKYQSEFGLHAFLANHMILSSNQLYDPYMKKLDFSFHMYSILSVPKLFFRTDGILQTKQDITLKLFASNNMLEPQYEFKMTFESIKDHSKLDISSKPPYTNIIVKIDDEQYRSDAVSEAFSQITDYSSLEIMMECASQIQSDLVCEVLYIGQAYGKDGSRNAVDRLLSHKTFQKILLDCQNSYSDRDLLIMLMDYNHCLLSSFDGISDEFEVSDNEDNEHIQSVTSDILDKKLIINIVEAAMIHYFRPKYNVSFSDSFPRAKHSSYRHCYDKDYNAISIENDWDIDGFPHIVLHTKTASIQHKFDFIRYTLNNSRNRKSMFDIFSADRKVNQSG